MVLGRRILVAVTAWSAVACSSLSAQGPVVIKEARLVRALVDARNGSPAGDVNPPADSVFLWVRFQVTDAATLPLDIELLKFEASNASNQRFKALGVDWYDEPDAVIRTIWEPVSRGGSVISDVTDLVTAHSDSVEFDLNKRGPADGHSARLKIKKVPAVFPYSFWCRQDPEYFNSMVWLLVL